MLSTTGKELFTYKKKKLNMKAKNKLRMRFILRESSFYIAQYKHIEKKWRSWSECADSHADLYNRCSFL